MRILQVNTSNLGGGAESVATRLLHGYRGAGHKSWLAVGKITERAEEGIYRIPSGYGVWGAGLGALSDRARRLTANARGAGRLHRILDHVSRPPSILDWRRGREDFNFPGTSKLLDLTTERPDIVHAHNLHGKYFDLRMLPQLSAAVPFILNPHDAWLLSGHCAHSFDCERWKTGCGECPDLNIHQPVRKDSSAQNWAVKKQIFSRSRLYVSTASQWLMDKVEKSMLQGGVVEAKVIPYGVEMDIFRPGDKASLRRELDIPEDAVTMLFVARGLRTNRWKDYPTLEKALQLAAARAEGRRIVFLGLGDRAPSRKMGNVEVRFVPFENEKSKVARYYQAADVYLHPAKVDTAPQTVMEAMACGVPIIASAVAGIPEQVKSLTDGEYGPGEATGFLVPRGDSEAMARAIVDLSSDDDLRQRLGRNAHDDAAARFDVRGYVSAFAGWFEDILELRRR